MLQVVATTDIMDGDELCFSYGERSNDDFFVHYGFVPLRNPRDEVILFESVESALDWYALESGLPVAVGGKSGDSEADQEVLVRDLRRIGAPPNLPPCMQCMHTGTCSPDTPLAMSGSRSVYLPGSPWAHTDCLACAASLRLAGCNRYSYSWSMWTVTAVMATPAE